MMDMVNGAVTMALKMAMWLLCMLGVAHLTGVNMRVLVAGAAVYLLRPSRVIGTFHSFMTWLYHPGC